MQHSVICPNCNQQTEIWIGDGGANLFDCEQCGQAFTYQPKPATAAMTAPPPPIAPPPVVRPQPIPAAQPQIIYVNTERRSTGFGSVFKGVVYVCLSLAFLVVALIVGIFVLAGIANASPEKAEAKSLVEITDWSWKKGGFGSVMEATFTVSNGSKYDIKDIEFLCVHSSSSGTVIDRNTRTVYEVLKAGEKRDFTVNMGFIHSQAKESSAVIKDFEIIK